MLSSVINSDRANRMNITIMRVFDSLEIYSANHQELEGKLKELERKVNKIDNIEYAVSTHNEIIKDIIEQIRRMIFPVNKQKKRIGFYGEYAAENHGGNSVDECGMNNDLNSIRRNFGRKSAEVHKEE
ncbi:MAG: hypothetical protein V1752_07740 [Candidatus Firestonebacteria bacterium]